MPLLASIGDARVAELPVVGPPTLPGPQFVMGLVAAPDAPGPERDFVFQVYASVGDDGTGTGTFADVLNPAFRSELRFVARQRQGDHYRWHAVITRSNDPQLVGQPVVLSATVHGDSAAPLQLELAGRSYRGRGLVVIAVIAILIGLLLPGHYF